MNITKSIARTVARIGFVGGSFVGGFQSAATGRWEGGERNRQRRRPGRALESQDWGLNYGLREELLSEARAQSQTFPLGRSINRKYANRCVGSCRMKWNTGDPEIDKIFAAGWQSWMRMADIGGRHHFRKLTKIAVESILRDGQIFAQKDRRGGFLQILPIESDRVSSDGILNVDAPGLVGGVGVDIRTGRTKFIRVWERSISGQFQNPQEIAAQEIVHVFDTDRFDAVTGVTHYHTILNSLRDLKETMLAERISAKRNSKLALLIKTVMGGASSPAVNLFENETPTQTGETKVNVEEVGDAANAYMFPTEDMKAHTSERPSEGWRWLMEWLVREIALGLDLPFGVVWNMAGLGGPAVRFEIAQANHVFQAFLEDILEPMWFRPIVGAWITLEMKSGRLPFHPAWYQFKTPRPASLTIDLGRDSKAGIAENLAGLTTATDWYAEADEEFEEQTLRLVHEAKFREAARRNVPIESITEVPLEQIRLITPNGNVSTDPQPMPNNEESISH